MNKDRLIKLFAESINNIKLFKLRTEQSLEWFKEIILEDKKITKFINPLEFFNVKKYAKFPLPGNIIAFNYNPILADSLDYYDNFPLVLILKIKNDGFLGINFHYLPHKYRLILMSRLYKYIKISNDNKTIIINMNYTNIIKKYELRYFRPCLKMYKFSRIKRFVYTATPDEWDMALFLPFEKFSKATKTKVWADSELKIRNIKR
jgi:hypothetical protein